MLTQNRYKVLCICVISNPRLLWFKSSVLPTPTIHCLISSHLCPFDTFCDLSAGSILKEWKAIITNGIGPTSGFCLLLQGILLVAAQTTMPSLQPPFYQHTLTTTMLKMTLGFLWGSGIIPGKGRVRTLECVKTFSSSRKTTRNVWHFVWANKSNLYLGF